MTLKIPRSIALVATVSMLVTAAYAAPISGVTTTSSMGTFGAYDLADITNSDGPPVPE